MRAPVFFPLLLTTLSLKAQTPLFTDATATLPAITNAATMDVQAADLDLDGDLDLVLANEFQRNRVLFNNGAGVFSDATAGRFSNVSHDSEDIAIADFNGDGWPDVVFAAEDDASPEYYWSTGGGMFADSSTLLPSSIANAVIAHDLNGDGKPDLVFGNAGLEIVLINDGTGHFTDETASRLPGQTSDVTQDLKFVDVDADGDADLLAGNEDGNKLYVNDGAGHFSDESAARLPAGLNQETRKIEAGDADLDGDPDLFLSNVNFIPGKNPQDRLLLNDGAGHFTDATATHLPADSQGTLDGIFTDVDADGDADLATCYFPNAPYKVLLNDGQGHFTDASASVLPAGSQGNGLGVIAPDLNGDGRPDLYFCNRGGKDKLYFRTAASLADAVVETDFGLRFFREGGSTRIQFFLKTLPEHLELNIFAVGSGLVFQKNLSSSAVLGENHVMWDRSGLAAGLYVIELRAGRFREVAWCRV